MSKQQNLIDANRSRSVIKQIHNRALNRFFLDVKSTALTNNRAHIKSGLRIRDNDSFVVITAKQNAFESLKAQYMPSQATMPEWWPLRVGADRPQLVIVFRPPGAFTSYQLSIPHYNGDRTPDVPSYHKGRIRGEMVLKDGSQIAVNARTEGEAERMVRALLRYVPSRFKGSNPIKIVKDPRSLNEVKVRPIYADFYPKGQLGGRQWRHYFSS
jgi:hypothetical protein